MLLNNVNLKIPVLIQYVKQLDVANAVQCLSVRRYVHLRMRRIILAVGQFGSSIVLSPLSRILSAWMHLTQMPYCGLGIDPIYGVLF